MSLSISHITFQMVFVRLYGQFDTLPPLFTLGIICLQTLAPSALGAGYARLILKVKTKTKEKQCVQHGVRQIKIGLMDPDEKESKVLGQGRLLLYRCFLLIFRGAGSCFD